MQENEGVFGVSNKKKPPCKLALTWWKKESSNEVLFKFPLASAIWELEEYSKVCLSQHKTNFFIQIFNVIIASKQPGIKICKKQQCLIFTTAQFVLGYHQKFLSTQGEWLK